MYHCANKSGEELALKLVAYLMKSESNLLTWNFNRSNQQGVQPSQIPKSTYYILLFSNAFTNALNLT